MRTKIGCFAILGFVCTVASFAASNAEHGIMMREGIVYISPDNTSAKLSNIGRGREVVILERSGGWVHVVADVGSSLAPDPAMVEDDDADQAQRNITGWMLDKGVITPATPDGDKVLFGEAVDSEAQASRRGGRRGAAQDAMRLYARLAEYFPNSPLAAEALYRSADIRWQLDAADAESRPSAKLRDPALRYPIDEDHMKKVMKKYPHTKWSDLASYHLIANKLCGDWQAEAKCPEKEAEIYTKYADEHPQSPKTPEALYNAAWRYSALIVIYKTNNEAKKADDSAARAINTAKRIISQFPNDQDWSDRAQRLIYMVQNNIPTFGNAVE